jgi:tetratricopeptide (TPR) repeat protein
MKYTLLFAFLIFSKLLPAQLLEASEQLSDEGALVRANDSLTVFIEKYPVRRYEVAAAYYLRGFNHMRMGNLYEARRDNESSLAIRHALIPEEAGKNLMLEGAIELAEGAAEKALELLKDAEAYPYIDDPEFPAVINLYKGDTYTKLGRIKEARTSSREAIDILNVVGGYSEMLLARLHYKLGTSYQSEKKWEEAIKWFQQSIDSCPPKVELIGKGYLALGTSYMNLERPKEAKENYRLAAKHFLQMHGEYAPQAAHVRLEQAKFHLQSGEKQLVEDLLNRVVGGLCPDLESGEELPELEGFCSDWQLLAEALQLRGQLLMEQYRQDKEDSQLERALDNIIASIAFYERYAFIGATNEELGRVLQQLHIYYGNAIEALLEIEKDKEAFYLADRALRSPSWAQAYHNNELIPQAAAPDKRGFQKALREIAYQYQQNPSDKDLSAALHAQRKAYYGYISSLEALSSTDFNLQLELSGLRVESLQGGVARKEAYLLYFFSSRDLYIFGLNEDDFEVATIPRDYPVQLSEGRDKDQMDIQKLAASFPDLIKANDTEQFAKMSPLLYECLLAPMKNIIKRKEQLYIYSEGPLAIFPFDALIEKERKAARFDSLKEVENGFSVLHVLP